MLHLPPIILRTRNAFDVGPIFVECQQPAFLTPLELRVEDFEGKFTDTATNTLGPGRSGKSKRSRSGSGCVRDQRSQLTAWQVRVILSGRNTVPKYYIRRRVV